jgi:hypothetical protein
MSTRALHEQIKMTEIPIPYSERLGRSKLSVVHDGRLFLESMIWTAMTYNPVRLLGLIGLTGIIVAALVLVGLVVARIGDTTSLGAWGVTAVFTALITSVGGISIFALGVTFNYMVSIFHKQPIRQGLFRKPIFKTPINYHFWWMGILGMLLGILLGAGSLSLAINQNWPIQRVWLYLLGSAMSTLVGLQLIIYWVLLHVLEELSQREILAERDLKGYGQ